MLFGISALKVFGTLSILFAIAIAILSHKLHGTREELRKVYRTNARLSAENERLRALSRETERSVFWELSEALAATRPGTLAAVSGKNDQRQKTP